MTNLKGRIWLRVWPSLSGIISIYYPQARDISEDSDSHRINPPFQVAPALADSGRQAGSAEETFWTCILAHAARGGPKQKAQPQARFRKSRAEIHGFHFQPLYWFELGLEPFCIRGYLKCLRNPGTGWRPFEFLQQQHTRAPLNRYGQIETHSLRTGWSIVCSQYMYRWLAMQHAYAERKQQLKSANV